MRRLESNHRCFTMAYHQSDKIAKRTPFVCTLSKRPRRLTYVGECFVTTELRLDRMMSGLQHPGHPPSRQPVPARLVSVRSSFDSITPATNCARFVAASRLIAPDQPLVTPEEMCGLAITRISIHSCCRRRHINFFMYRHRSEILNKEL